MYQEYEAFERKDVKLQEDMKHAKALIKKQQAAIAKEAKKEADTQQETLELQAQVTKTFLHQITNVRFSVV